MDVFANKIKKGEKKSIRILERRYSIDFEKSACEKDIYIGKQEIEKQTSVYKWQCEYPPSPDFAMTLMTLIFLLSDRSNLD